MNRRIGVIGAGLMGLTHVRLLSGAVSGAEVVAVSDAVPAAAERAAAEAGVTTIHPDALDLINDEQVEAVVVASPAETHEAFAIACIEAGKPVLCEKPLCGRVSDTEAVLAVAEETGTLLWEAFVFPFQPQLLEIRKLIADGAIGDLMEIKSNFHFLLRNPANIRLSSELEGGALLDVGCYPVRIAQELFGPDYEGAWAHAVLGGEGVDVDTWGVLDYAGGRRLLLSCGFGRSYDTFTTLEGTAGQIRVTNPFHPGAADSYDLVTPGADARTFSTGGQERSFTAAIRHIQAVIEGNEAPRQLAVDTSLATARALADLAASFSGT